MSNIRIRRIYLADFQQFRDTLLDFRGPNGKASDRICLIGRNGTGKSTVLRLIWGFLKEGSTRAPDLGAVVFEFENADGIHVWGRIAGRHRAHMAKDVGNSYDFGLFRDVLWQLAEPEGQWFQSQNLIVGDLRVFCPSEASENLGLAIDEVPPTSLNAALQLDKLNQREHLISSETISTMWTTLILRIQKREVARQTYENAPESLDKTKRQLVEEFNAAHPDVLEALATLWNRILEPAGLEFDFQNATIPAQLSENLEAYIRRRDSKERVPYNALSTGIRDFLFRLGHLFLLYFQQPVESGFVLVDEPENSLFPDFLFDLVETYDQIVGKNTQLFMATHSPIVAAQFEPWQRIILDWDEDAFVTARKGSAPIGDDPNAVLESDFGLESLLGPKGREKYEEYLNLKKQIRHAAEAEKPDLVHEAAQLGKQYGFT